MLSLSRLRTIAHSADSRRSHVFEAIRQIVERFPSEAHDEFLALLEDPAVASRSKVFVLYWLREFGKFNDLVTLYAPRFTEQIDDVYQDVERSEEDEVDPFSVEGFPDV
jgi:hypothetical protein